jgi:Flp pilus assembly protein TadD
MMNALIVPILLLVWSTAVEHMVSATRGGGNTNALRAVREELKTAEAPSPAMLHYARGYVARTLAVSPGVSADERKQLIEDAVAQLERAVQLEPRNAEAHALLGATYGVLISVAPMRGMELGRKANDSLARAMELAPHNPRVHLLHGTSAFHRPVLFGGGAERAEPHLRKALSLFANEPAAKPWPNWGRYEAHLYLGMSLEKQQHLALARQQYEQALAIAPDSEYVRSVLIPRTKKK